MNRLWCVITVCLLCVIASPAVWAEDTPQAADTSMVHIKAISWEKLAACLPASLEGFETGEDDGGTMNMPNPEDPSHSLSYSVIEREYSNDDKSIHLEIMDSGLNQLLLAPFMMTMEFDGPDQTIKNAEFAGNPAKLVLNKEDGKVRTAQYLVLVADRLLMAAEGNENVSSDEIKAALEKVDFAKLAELVK